MCYSFKLIETGFGGGEQFGPTQRRAKGVEVVPEGAGLGRTGAVPGGCPLRQGCCAGTGSSALGRDGTRGCRGSARWVPGQHSLCAGATGLSRGPGPLPADCSPRGAAAAPGPAGLDAAVGMQELTAHADKIRFRTKCSGSQNLLLKHCRRRSRWCTPLSSLLQHPQCSLPPCSHDSSLGTVVASLEQGLVPVAVGR